MFERFTDRARRVVVLAQEEARMLNHNYIGTEHLLLGLLHEDQGIAARVLGEMDVSLALVRAEVLEVIGTGESAPSGHIPFTPRAKKVLELSLREALQLGTDYIGTEHLLLGVVREGEGAAAQILVKLGKNLSTVRAAVLTTAEQQSADYGERRDPVPAEPARSEPAQSEPTAGSAPRLPTSGFQSRRSSRPVNPSVMREYVSALAHPPVHAGRDGATDGGPGPARAQQRADRRPERLG
jgi:ATP-dependent Clp protease ATP-binding subunit ClpA